MSSMKRDRRYIPVPVELRHFNISDYRRKGINDVSELSDWADGIVSTLDKWNETGNDYEGQTEDILNQVVLFSSYALKNVRYSMWKDKDYIESLIGRINYLERKNRVKNELLNPQKKSSSKTKKSVSDAEKLEVERIAKMMK